MGLRPNQIVRLGIARTFQNVKLFPNMTVLENAMVGQHCRSKAGPFGSILRTGRVRREEQQIRERAQEALSFFGPRLAGYRQDQPAFTLSYANRRRLEMARALATEPRLILLDEPTAGMNPQRDARAPRPHRADAGPSRDHRPPDRARHARREGCLRSRDRLRLRTEDRRGHLRGGRADEMVIEAYLGSRHEEPG